MRQKLPHLVRETIIKHPEIFDAALDRKARYFCQGKQTGNRRIKILPSEKLQKQIINKIT